jgi:subtilisin family serine protease
LKATNAHEAALELKKRDLIDRYIHSVMGDIKLAAAPNDPRFGDQTGLNGTAAADVGAIDAWSALTGSSSVIVAVIDSGANVGHEDLQPNIWTNPGETPGNGADEDGNGFNDDVHGYDFVAGSGDVSDPVNHGTGIAGIIGAVGNNGVGIAGINWSVKILPLKFTDGTGKGSLSTAVTAIDYAIAKGAKVINASFVMDLSAGDPAKVQMLQDAVQKAIDAGIVFVAAAGNKFGGTGTNIDSENVYPAALPVEPILAVAAVDGSGALADFSNFGPTSVDIAAPGVSILSTAADGGYSGTKGTSIATPFVAGAAALILSHNPSLSPAQVKSAIVGNAKASSGLSGKVASGGTLDLRAALASLGVSVSSGSSGSSSSSAPSSSGSTVASAEKTASSSSGKSGGGCALINYPSP